MIASSVQAVLSNNSALVESHNRGKTMNSVGSASVAGQIQASSPTRNALLGMGDRLTKLSDIVSDLETRLGICLRGPSPTADKGAEPQIVPDSELVGALMDANNRIDYLGERIQSITGRVTL